MSTQPKLISKIKINHTPSQVELDAMGVNCWAVSTQEVATFPWVYECDETCYFLQGNVTVTPDGGTPLTIVKGDLVTFPEGLHCTW
ncbi:MAG TPA: cupin domain-containing protein, partial [Gammaproteobacteria bacterium]|nr:cupin domain-containing protein [Gammaproteobacteria bacterium]